MIFRTHLKAGEPNVFSKPGRYFYLLSAADSVRIRFTDSAHYTTDFESDMREGMSADFPVSIDNITLKSDTAQYVEFWLGDTKLDYSKLAAGGASANIQAGRAWAGLGSSIAIPADFRRKKITVMPLGANVNIGGADISSSNSWPLQVGVEREIDSRGDIHTFVQPASIGGFTGTVTPFGDTNPRYPRGLIVDDATGNFLLLDSDTPLYALAADENTFLPAAINWTAAESNGYVYMGEVDGSHYLLATAGSAKGRIFKSSDGFLSWVFVSNSNPATYLKFLNIYDGWVSPDGGTMIVTGRSLALNAEYNAHLLVLVSYDGFKTFAEYKGLSTPSYGFSNVHQYNATEFLIRDDTDGVYKLTLGEGLELISTEKFEDLRVTPDSVFGIKDGFNARLFRSIDGGYTFTNVTTAEINAHNVDRLEVIGTSLLLIRPKSIALISDYSQSDQLITLQTGEAQNVSLGNKNLIALKGTKLYFAPSLGGAPATPFFQKIDLESITDGAVKGVTLQWLAELN